MIYTPWAILLCKMKDIPNEPHASDFYEQLFCQQGAGKGGVLDYWQEISNGTLDLSGSKVFGWFQLDHTLKEQALLSLYQQLEKIYAVAKGDVPFKSFYGIVAVYNFPNGSGGRVLDGNYLNLGDATKTYGFAGLGVDEITKSPSFAAHEMGHGYGLDHSWGFNGMPVGYGDRWDIMSYANVYSFTGPNFGESGPGLVAPYLIKKGWLPDNRVSSVDLHTDLPRESHLAPLGHADVEGPLAIRFEHTLSGLEGPSTWVIEYRHKDGWDAGIPYDAVLIHEVPATGLSYLRSVLVACQRYLLGYGYEIFVKTIDAQKQQATVLICKTPDVDLKGIGVTTVSKKKTGAGTYHFPGDEFCPKKDYPYTRYAVESQANYEAVINLFEPYDPATLEYEWRLNGALLKSPNKYVVLEVSNTAAVPPPVGATDYHHQATLSFEIDGNKIVLYARPEDANFVVVLEVDVNIAGCQRAYKTVQIDFKGDVLEFDESYYKDMFNCLQRRLGRKHKWWQNWRWPWPDPEELKKKIAEIVHEMVQSEPRLAAELQRTFGHIPGVTFRPGLRPTGSRLLLAGAN